MDHNEISGYSTSKSIQNVTNNIEAFLRDSANVQNALEQSAKNNEEYFNSLEARIQATRKQIDELEHENRITNLKLNLIQSQIEEVGLEAIQLEEEALQLMMKNKTMKCQIASFQSILTEQQGIIKTAEKSMASYSSDLLNSANKNLDLLDLSRSQT